MSSPGDGSIKQWSATKLIAAADTSVAIQAAPSATEQLVVQQINWIIKTAGNQTYTIGDGTTNLVTAPANHAVGWYALPWGELGVALAAGSALTYASVGGAGPLLMIAAYGYTIDSAGD